MKKVIAFIGSRKGSNSKTYKFTKLMLDKLVEKCNEIEYEIITPDKYEIRPCLSCNNCFLKGNCNQDNKDDMGMIKKKILESDLIILGSPVFAHHVSGDMKTFIDRISYWLHIFRLANKKFITISTSGSNGNIFVNNYLKYIFDIMGAQNLLNIEVTTKKPNLFRDIEFMEDELMSYVELIYNGINDSVFISTESQEGIFKTFKEIVSDYDKNTSEYLYWKNSGLLECETYQEYLLRDK